MPKVLVVYHSQSGNTEAMAKAVAEGAKSVPGTEVEVKRGLEATSEDLVACDAIALGTPDYFSYMAGGLKDFFDRTLYPTEGKVTGKPYAAFVSHGGGGTPALQSVQRVSNSFKFEKAAEPVLCYGSPSGDALEQCRALGRALAQAAK